MIVLIGGMYRSGSTFVFNIAREVLNAEGTVKITLDKLEDAIKFQGNDNLIIKSHTPDDLISGLVRMGGAKCICTFRRPEDAVASWMNTFGFDLEQSLTYLAEWIEWHDSIKHKTLNIPFEMLEQAPFRVILRIQSYLMGGYSFRLGWALRRKYDKGRIKNLYEFLPETERTENIGFSHYDRETLFHRRHISSTKWKLGVEEQRLIRDRFRHVLDGKGNYIA